MSAIDFVQGEVRVTEHRGSDDLLSAGLGLAGLAGMPSALTDPLHPTAQELRRRAIQMSWKGIADLGPLGGYGRVYGGVPDVPGREYQAFAWIPGRHAPHRVLLQLPDHFDTTKRCLMVTAASGSRGVYGAIALAGAWGLPRGCAVAYTDKGAGAGYFDVAEDSGVALDGRRARRGEEPLEFAPPPLSSEHRIIAVKHAHSGDHSEADWGQHVLQAAQFGLAMLDRAFPALAPFTPQNTRIIATGLSNGGGAVLQAAGLDDAQMLAGVVALEPNVYVQEERPLYDYSSEAAIWLPCALLDARFASVPFARGPGGVPSPIGLARGASLRARGLVGGAGIREQAAQALEHLHAGGWTDQTIATAASTTAFDLWRTINVAYASAYLRRGPADMPCGFRYAMPEPAGPADAALRASWWADGSGIVPGNGIVLQGGTDRSADPMLGSLEDLRALWSGADAAAQALHTAVAATAVKRPRAELPLWLVHGAEDGLLPTAFTTDPYVDWLRLHGGRPVYWKVPHAQHFDAFLMLSGFGERYLPLLPYGYAALDRLWAHLYEGAAWPPQQATPAGSPRGAGVLDASMLGLG